jgi:hypothetical protein
MDQDLSGPTFRVFVLAVTPEKKRLNQITFNEEIYGSPTAANGTFYIAMRTHLCAIAQK